VSSKPADLASTQTKRASVDWTKAGVDSSSGAWGHPGDQMMGFTMIASGSSSGDGLYSGAVSVITRSSGVEIRENPAFRRADGDPSLPAPPQTPPPAIVAAANTTPAVSANQAQSNASAPRAAVALQQAGQLAAHSATPAGAAGVASAIVNAPTPAIASTSNQTNISHDPPDLSWSDGILGINTELTAFTEILQRPGVFASAGQSVDFMEKLLISDAAALAQVANGVAMRLNEENAVLWKGAAGLLGVAMIVAAGASRERPASQVPRRRRRNPRHLCIDERYAADSEF
ncbi:MAG TPA: hypothetical protein VMB71_07115, partial [Acetobacteraceae bacterium]|nr:hypothetical protein [Acetobacteraceae bacterium]